MVRKIKNYDESLDYLYGKLSLYQRDGRKAIKKGLENITRLAQELDNPQNKYPKIHIAGTNGKGSTAHMIASILQSAGYQVGMYTSPHYRDFRERIKINGQLMPKRSVTHFLNTYRNIIEDIWPTFFEITVAMAFDYFDKQKVDIAIIETGMGGRLDSTNIISPICSVITNISYDHQASLGDTLKEIAGEKAGIIKPNIPVVIGELHPETKSTFIAKAKAENSPIFWAENIYELKLADISATHQSFICNYDSNSVEIKLQAGGNFQQQNLRTTLTAIDRIKKEYNINIQHIKAGLASLQTSTRYIGRWQLLNSNPLIIADAAHNEAGIEALLTTIKQLDLNNLHIVFGMVKDKDPNLILGKLPKDATYYFCSPKIPRALHIDSLLSAATANKLMGKKYTTVSKALSVAKLRVINQGGNIIVTGSSYVVAEVV